MHKKVHPRFDAAPLKEAVFELFSTASESVPGIGAEQVDKFFAKFPKYQSHPQILGQIQAQVTLQGDAPESSVQIVRNAKRCWDQDKTRGVLVGPGVFAFNVLQPYETINKELPVLRELLSCFLETMKPPGLLVLGQRYINQIVRPIDAEPSPSKLFTIYPHLPKHAASHSPFTVQIEFGRFADGVVVVTLALAASTPTEVVYSLDLYARTTELIPRSPEEMLQWHLQAHDQIVDAFLFAISKDARKLFREK